MTISARILADSLNGHGDRLTTFELRYPYIIHAQVMTHRVFSRNSSSARAIPVKRLIQSVKDDPYIPQRWGKNQKGMQAFEDLDEVSASEAEAVWYQAIGDAVWRATQMDELGVHKQFANRLLLPFSHVNVVLTTTELRNFFDLRIHKEAQDEIDDLARAMLTAYSNSSPRLLGRGQWHLPYVTEEDVRTSTTSAVKHGDSVLPGTVNDYQLALISAARCARVSYKTHDGATPGREEDLELASRLLSSKHLSPFEHQAWADQRVGDRWMAPQWHGNFSGFVQHRKTLE